MSTSATWEAITRSSEAVGSSASNSRPPVERARASATRCASPPDNSGIQRSANCRTPTPASARSARRRASSPRTPLKREGSSTFSRTVNSSSNCGSWKTFPIISRRTLARSPSVARVTSMPATTIDPHDGRARPATHARSEDFPEPLGPTKEARRAKRNTDPMQFQNHSRSPHLTCSITITRWSHTRTTSTRTGCRLPHPTLWRWASPKAPPRTSRSVRCSRPCGVRACPQLQDPAAGHAHTRHTAGSLNIWTPTFIATPKVNSSLHLDTCVEMQRRLRKHAGHL